MKPDLKIMYFSDGTYVIGTPDDISVNQHLKWCPWVSIVSVESYIDGKTHSHAAKVVRWYKPEDRVPLPRWCDGD